MRKTIAVALSAALGGCAYLPKKPIPQFDPAQDPKSQASTFINAGNTALLAGTKKAFLSECNVLVGEETSARASTSGGLFSEAGGNRRADASVTSIYYLKGMDDAKMQALADSICQDAEAQLAAAGFEVIKRASLTEEPYFQKLTGNGKPSPFEWNPGGTKYKVFAPNKTTVFNPMFLGAGGGLSMAFKQASGESPLFHEANLANKLDAHAVRFFVMLDFSQLKGQKESMWAKKDHAKVEEKVLFAVRGKMEINPRGLIKCWQRFGKEECGNTKAKVATLGLKYALTSDEKFYTEIADATSTGDKAAAVLSKGLAIVSMLGGVSSKSFKVTRTNVTVDPAAYEPLAKKMASALLQMQTASAMPSGI